MSDDFPPLDIMVPKPDKTIAEQAQILAMQQISDTLRRLSNTIE
jgi:hypothetical protein